MECRADQRRRRCRGADSPEDRGRPDPGYRRALSSLTETGYAKLNLALHVRGKRDDGYHEIETIFAFCEDGDVLSGEAADELSLEVSGPFGADTPVDDANLVIEAARVVRLATGVSGGVRLHLIKNLPIAS